LPASIEVRAVAPTRVKERVRRARCRKDGKGHRRIAGR